MLQEDAFELLPGLGSNQLLFDDLSLSPDYGLHLFDPNDLCSLLEDSPSPFSQESLYSPSPLSTDSTNSMDMGSSASVDLNSSMTNFLKGSASNDGFKEERLDDFVTDWTSYEAFDCALDTFGKEFDVLDQTPPSFLWEPLNSSSSSSPDNSPPTSASSCGGSSSSDEDYQHQHHALLQPNPVVDKPPRRKRKTGPRAQIKSESENGELHCPYENCEKVYLKTSHLKAHVRRHTGEKPFICSWPECRWRFSRSDELGRHFRCHTGDKPYECNICRKRFSRSDHLSKHRKVHERGRGSDGPYPVLLSIHPTALHDPPRVPKRGRPRNNPLPISCASQAYQTSQHQQQQQFRNQ